MAGHPISIAETIVLPAQPAIGAVTYIPLGGDGYTAPFAAYSVQGFEMDGDASGGVLTQIIQTDERFCALVSYVAGSINMATPANSGARQTISSARQVPLMNLSQVVVALPAAFTAEINVMWNPPAVILPGTSDIGTIANIWPNVEDDTYRMHCLIYLFNIRVRELTPMGPLLFARGST